MKIGRTIIIFLISSLPLLAAAQKHSFLQDSAFVRLVPGLPSNEPFDTAQPWDKAGDLFLYVLSDHDLYNYFGYTTGSFYRDIDFNRYHIMGSQQCVFCIRTCDPGASSCHRNACQYEWVWALRDNTKAFDLLPSSSKLEMDDGWLPDGKRWWGEDTVLSLPGKEKEMTWYSRVGGDCHARFEFRLYRDRHYPVYLLKEMNHYGGCRAGGSWLYSTSFLSPEREMHFVRRSILLPRE